MKISRRSALMAIGAAGLLPVLRPISGLAAEPAKIGVIGAGSLGGTVGKLLVQAGHEVRFSSRHPEELEDMAKGLGVRASVGSPLSAAQFGTVLLFAVPYEAIPQLARDLADAIKGKIVMDACNPPLSGGSGPLIDEAKANGVAVTTSRYLPGARVVRAFSSVDATVLESSGARSPHIGVPIASDDSDALKVVAALVTEVGCDPVITGNLASAKSFQQGGPGFRAHMPADQLRKLLAG